MNVNHHQLQNLYDCHELQQSWLNYLQTWRSGYTTEYCHQKWWSYSFSCLGPRIHGELLCMKPHYLFGCIGTGAWCTVDTENTADSGCINLAIRLHSLFYSFRSQNQIILFFVWRSCLPGMCILGNLQGQCIQGFCLLLSKTQRNSYRVFF